MASENANSGDICEFEPDSNFFDNFWDGMDVLIDNCRAPAKDEGSWIAGKSDEESDCSSGCDRMVIDLPSSPESRSTKEVKNSERSDIKDVLTNRVLAHLEKSSSNRRNKDKNSFPSNQLVVDVLDRLKKSVQQKSESSTSNTSSHQAISKNNYSISKADDEVVQINIQEEISSTLSTESGEQKREPNKTMTKLLRFFFSEKKSRYEHPQASSSRGVCAGKHLDKDRRKRKRHKKHKSSKSKEEEYRYFKKHRHRKTKSKKKKAKTDLEGSKTSDFSLESVSSEDDDDILNKQHSEEDRLSLDEAANADVAKSLHCEHIKQPDCEEGEVLSSSSDWESECFVKKKHEDLKSLQIRPECFSPLQAEGSRARRFENLRSPPSPTWPSHRMRAEEHRRYIYRQMRSPVHHVRMSPCPWREQPSDRQRLRIAIPRLESISPVPIPLRARSPNSDRLSSELPPPFIDGFGYPIEMLPSRRIDHVPPYHRPRSPWEEVHESRHMFKTSAPMEIHTREVIPCQPLRIERRFPPEPGLCERRKKPGLLSRCLQEIRHRSYKPGRFVYDPELKTADSAESSSPLGRYSSPLYSSQSRKHRLNFASPNVRHVGTSSVSISKAVSSMSVGCQTIEQEILRFTEDQVQKIDSALTKTSKVLPVISKVTKERSLTVHLPGHPCTGVSGNTTVSEMLQLIGTPERHHTPVRNNGEQDFVQEVVSRVTMSKTMNYLASSHGILEMWKTIVSSGYPDLNEKERE